MAIPKLPSSVIKNADGKFYSYGLWSEEYPDAEHFGHTLSSQREAREIAQKHEGMVIHHYGTVDEKIIYDARPSDARRYAHFSPHGTTFMAARRDFRGGVEVHYDPELPLNKLLVDVACMAAQHQREVHPELRSFAGYGCIQLIMKPREK